MASHDSAFGPNGLRLNRREVLTLTGSASAVRASGDREKARWLMQDLQCQLDPISPAKLRSKQGCCSKVENIVVHPLPLGRRFDLVSRSGFAKCP